MMIGPACATKMDRVIKLIKVKVFLICSSHVPFYEEPK